MSGLRDEADFVTAADERRLIERLRAGDEAAFEDLVARYHTTLQRLAGLYVRDRAVVEEVVQETWLGVHQGIGRFEGRSSLRTWLFRILVNRAKTRGQREARTVPFASLETDTDRAEPAVPADRFHTPETSRFPGHWAAAVPPWPEERLLAAETKAVIDAAIASLPPRQREVITLRDVVGASAEEVCSVLDLSETNQRVLLHRARSRVRGALEKYLQDE